jgi:hypothetical protein
MGDRIAMMVWRQKVSLSILTPCKDRVVQACAATNFCNLQENRILQVSQILSKIRRAQFAV